MFFKIIWFILKWALIIGVPIILGIILFSFLEDYDRHKKKCHYTNKRAFITFKEFEKLYPVSVDRWFFRPGNCVNGKEIYSSEKYGFYLLFRSNTMPYTTWENGYTQMIFKTLKDYICYTGWLEQRNKAIKNHQEFANQKQELENMEEVLKVIQSDIDRVQAEANKKIEESAKTTIEIQKRLEFNEKGKLVEVYDVQGGNGSAKKKCK